jgi:hypothetical protein
MNEKGEATILTIMCMVVLTSITLLCCLELRESFGLLKKRTNLFLCAKELKGEHHQHLNVMGRTNWALKNIEKLKWTSLLIPGLQTVGMNANKAKKLLENYQNIHIGLYLNTLKNLSHKNCRPDPEMFKTAYVFNSKGLERNFNGTAKKRSNKWNYTFVSTPYVLNLKIDSSNSENLNPQIFYQVSQSMVKPSFPLLFVY